MSAHQDFSVKSNARRAAKKLGLDPNSVKTIMKAGAKIYRLPIFEYRLPISDPSKPARKVLAKSKVAKQPKKAKSAKPEGKKFLIDTSPTKEFVAGLKFQQVADMLREPGGASIGAITKATGWLPHTARARISVNVSKLLNKGEKIERTRPEKGGESVYAIVPNKQQDLPLEDAA